MAVFEYVHSLFVVLANIATSSHEQRLRTTKVALGVPQLVNMEIEEISQSRTAWACIYVIVFRMALVIQ